LIRARTALAAAETDGEAGAEVVAVDDGAGVVGAGADGAALDVTVGDGVAVRVGAGRCEVGAGCDGAGVPDADEQVPLTAPVAQDWRDASVASVRAGPAPPYAMRATTTATTTRTITAPAARYARRGSGPSG
jgi:hypothetical protein